jgi:hypothetical protein
MSSSDKEAENSRPRPSKQKEIAPDSENLNSLNEDVKKTNKTARKKRRTMSMNLTKTPTRRKRVCNILLSTF